MARTALTPVTTAAAGVVLAAAAAVDAVNGNSFVNTGRELIEITNGSGSPITVTFITTQTYNIGAVTYAIADLAVTIAAGVTKACGPFDKTLFNDSATGTVGVDFSSGTTVTARVISLGTA
jgi:uncharacterized protein (DUF697 family)